MALHTSVSFYLIFQNYQNGELYLVDSFHSTDNIMDVLKNLNIMKKKNFRHEKLLGIKKSFHSLIPVESYLNFLCDHQWRKKTQKSYGNAANIQMIG